MSPIFTYCMNDTEWKPNSQSPILTNKNIRHMYRPRSKVNPFLLFFADVEEGNYLNLLRILFWQKVAYTDRRAFLVHPFIFVFPRSFRSSRQIFKLKVKVSGKGGLIFLRWSQQRGKIARSAEVSTNLTEDVCRKSLLIYVIFSYIYCFTP